MRGSHSRQPPRSRDSNLCTPATRFKLLTRDLSQPSCQGHRMPISQVRKFRALAQEAQNESQYSLSICFSPAALCLDQEAQVGARQSALSQPGWVDARGVDKSTRREPWQTAHVTGRRTAGAGPGPTHAPLWASGSPRVQEAPDPGWAGDTPQSPSNYRRLCPEQKSPHLATHQKPRGDLSHLKTPATPQSLIE